MDSLITHDGSKIPGEFEELIERQSRYPKIAYYRILNGKKLVKIIVRNGAGMQLYDFTTKKIVPCWVHILDSVARHGELVTDPKEIESIEILYEFRK